MGKHKEDSIGMSLRLPTEMYHAFSTAAKEAKVSMTDVFKDAVERFLKGDEEPLITDLKKSIENLEVKIDNLTAITTAVLKTVINTDTSVEKMSKELKND